MRRDARFGLLLTGTFLAAIVWFTLRPIPLNLNAPYIIPLLHTFIVGCTQLILAYHTCKAFIKDCFDAALLMSCGHFLFAVSVIELGWLFGNPQTRNLAVTVFGVGIYASSALFLFSSAYISKLTNESKSTKIRSTLIAGSLIFLLFAGLALLTQQNLLPLFYDENGFTPLRQFVLWISIIQIFIAALAYLRIYRLNCAKQLAWYALLLMLNAVGLSGLALSHPLGDAVNWVGRLAQYAGGYYAVLFILSARMDAKRQEMDVSGILSNWFTTPEESFRLISDTSANGVFLIDHHLRIVLLNNSAMQMCGYRMAELQERSFLELLVPEPDRASLRAEWETFSDRGANVYVGRSFEMELLHKDGGRVPVALTYTVRGFSRGFLCTIIVCDITENIRNLETIRRQNEILRSINQIYGFAVGVKSFEELGGDCMLEVERATGSHYSFAGEVDGEGLLCDRFFTKASAGSECGRKHQVHMGTDRYRARGLFGAIIQGKQRLLTNAPLTHPDFEGLPEGHTPLESFMGIPYLINGEVKGILCVANRPGGYSAEHLEILETLTPTVFEVIQRFRAEEEIRKNAAELEQKNTLITDFFINISHELKTPLSIILIQLELIGRTKLDAKTARCVSNATQNAYRLTRLIANILDTAKISAGAIEPNWVNADLVALISDVRESVAPYARSRGIDLTLRTPLVTKVMLTDAEKVERILFNLLSNAIKHTDEFGRIGISLRDRSDGGAVISVKDTGTGICADKLPMIFDRYTQADTSLSRRADGCGIGLWLAKSLVEMLGGTIHVISKEGVGSTFTVELPHVEASIPRWRTELGGFDLSRKAAVEMSDIYVNKLMVGE